MEVAELNVVHKKEVLQTRHISTLPELANILAYKIEYFMNDNLIEEKQGLAPYDVLKIYLETGKWSGDFLGKLVNIQSLTNILRDPNEDFKIKDITILNPYDCGVVLDEKKEFTLVNAMPQDFKVYDYLGGYFTTGIYMDYRVGIHEWSYDLEELLEVLKQRDDVIFVNSPQVEDIPYFNVTKKMSETISFWWMPSEDDYHKVFDSELTMPVCHVPEIVFGVKPKQAI